MYIIICTIISCSVQPYNYSNAFIGSYRGEVVNGECKNWFKAKCIGRAAVVMLYGKCDRNSVSHVCMIKQAIATYMLQMLHWMARKYV